MSLDKRLLEILCCPSTKQPVFPLSTAQLDALNRAVKSGNLVGADGEKISHPMTAGLITRDGRTVYRVEDGIPVMLVDQAIALSQVDNFPA
jgi:uncharacterized protein YbaR (Trm112 family)